jgi:succinate-semialdehyde dehydrogenase/glutarate-semialdehyde dehydrogenase
MKITTINPATGKAIETYETMTKQEVRDVEKRAREAFLAWRERTIAERAAFIQRLAGTLRRNADPYARLATLEMGKPIKEAHAEVEKCAWLCEVYAENGERWLAEETVEADGKKHRVAFSPLGVILSVMPWNFPFWQAFRFAVPTVLAGNTSILKHASNVPRCARAIEESFREAGFPPHVLSTIFADHPTVSALIASDGIQGVSLTGSTAAGAGIAAEAGRNLKKVVLELGGSDPFIVLEDADVDFAVRGAVLGRTLNTGQSCIAAKRFIVAKTIAEPFTKLFAEKMSALVVGDPNDEATNIGPLVNEAALVELEDQLARSVAAGAKIVTGGKRLDRPGFFLSPTVVANVTPEMPIAREEVFGPIAPVLVVRDDEEALRMANATDFGLGGSVWTRDLERGERIARRVEAGSVFVNSIVKSDPRMPFGGVKKSGIGRELSQYGLREFVNVQGINLYEQG